MRWVHDSFVEDRRWSRLLGLLVEDLEGGDERPVGILAEPAHTRADTAHDLFARLGMTATGARFARPVDRPVEADVGAVHLVERSLCGVESFVASAVDLHCQHAAGRVA
ncbi:MAG: hypothetical protein V9F00_07875 [Nocardioides sp.]